MFCTVRTSPKGHNAFGSLTDGDLLTLALHARVLTDVAGFLDLSSMTVLRQLEQLEDRPTLGRDLSVNLRGQTQDQLS